MRDELAVFVPRVSSNFFDALYVYVYKQQPWGSSKQNSFDFPFIFIVKKEKETLTSSSVGKTREHRLHNAVQSLSIPASTCDGKHIEQLKGGSTFTCCSEEKYKMDTNLFTRIDISMYQEKKIWWRKQKTDGQNSIVIFTYRARWFFLPGWDKSWSRDNRLFPRKWFHFPPRNKGLGGIVPDDGRWRQATATFVTLSPARLSWRPTLPWIKDDQISSPLGFESNAA